MRRFFTGTCLRLSRELHASPSPCISRAHFPSRPFVTFPSLTLDSDTMSPSAAESNSQPSTVRVPQPIRTQLTDPTDSMDKVQSPPSVGPGAYDTSVVPPSHDDRTIVLCFDGTGDQFDADNSNIVQLFSMLKKDDKSQQVVYYQAGIGTYTIPEIATPFWSNIQKKIDMALGNHLDAHVMGGYEFLMENYHAGDKICIFGFSRGAYTARALAGMVHKVGLLPAGNHQQVPFAYKMFTREDKTGWKQSNAFKKAFSVDVEIEFIGVWDTVCSVGLVPHNLPFTSSNTSIRYFRHAIALDEHRAKFKANHYHLRKSDDEKGIKPGEMPHSNHRFPHYHRKNHQHHHKSQLNDDVPSTTDVKEVWFAGCHCDIGGGSVPNERRNSVARIPLRWMIREIFAAKTGIQFHLDSFKSIGLDPTTLYPFVTPRSKPLEPYPSTVTELRTSAHKAEATEATLTEEGQASPIAASTFQSEEDEELADAISPIYDQLKLSWSWWILEIIPLRHRVQDRKDTLWKPYWSINWGGPRRVPELGLPEPVGEGVQKIHVHRSVKTRMEAEGLEGGKYTPKAKFEHLDFEWVD